MINILFDIIVKLLIILFLFSSCSDDDSDDTVFSYFEQFRIKSLSSTAEFLFVFNRDTNTSRTEIYSMDRNGEGVTRIAYTEEHHFIMGVDPVRRYLVCSRSEEDTNDNGELDDWDRRSLWIIDLITKNEVRLTDLENHC
ncbi:MAG: hypothetical protein SVZ03_10005 [Spirochaetota bacterium]|nr:hypothetical protein [Spirochaetota bacterium]